MLLISSMENSGQGTEAPYKFGDRSTSDVVVRMRTPDGRDDWVYCHSSVLVNRSRYFADRLSENWPTCQILDARNCVEVNCQESDFDYHINVLRLLYIASSKSSALESGHGVKNALGILRVANELGCPQIVASCVEYVEAMPWEEAEEEEILQTVPFLGTQAKPILARLEPVNQSAIVKIFLSAVQFATSSPPLRMNDLKSSVQQQLEYLLTEDDDAPLLASCDEIKVKTKECVKRLLSTFIGLLESLSRELESSRVYAKVPLLQTYLSDLLWACQILSKFELMRDMVTTWIDISTTLVKMVDIPSSETEILETKLKVIEVTTKILEAIAYGTVILHRVQRLYMVKVWLPFARTTKAEIDAACNRNTEEDSLVLKVDTELWQSLESAFVSTIVALPSTVQAEILTEWLGDQHIYYPDLTEAFEVWCYRSKVAKKRVASFV